MRVGVSDAVKDGVMFQQPVESIEIHIHREDEQQERDRDGEPAPGRRAVADASLVERTDSARNQEEQDGKHTAS